MDETPLSASTRSALEAFKAESAALPPDAHFEAIWRVAVSSMHPARSPGLLKPVALVAVGVLLFVSWKHWRPTPVTVAAAQVEAAPGAQWREAGNAVTIDRGQLWVRPRGDRTLEVITPEVRVLVQRAAAFFDVTPRGTVLAVESGEVTWRGQGRTGHVSAGERVTIGASDPNLALAPRGAPLERCAGAGYETCLTQVAQGNGLTAETALYELAMVAHDKGQLREAVHRFGVYSSRFPDGAFAPEASIGLMLDLRADDRPREAALEAARFGSHFTSDPRVGAVRRWAEQLR